MIMLNFILVALTSMSFMAVRSQSSPSPRPTGPTLAPTQACACETYEPGFFGNSSDVRADGNGCTRCSYASLIDCEQSDVTVCECPTESDCDYYEAWGNAVSSIALATASAFTCLCCCCIVFAVVSGVGCIGVIVACVVVASQAGKRKQQNVVVVQTQGQAQQQQAAPVEGPPIATVQTTAGQPQQPVQYVDQYGNPLQVVTQPLVYPQVSPQVSPNGENTQQQ